jgi:hypothetical protein
MWDSRNHRTLKFRFNSLQSRVQASIRIAKFVAVTNKIENKIDGQLNRFQEGRLRRMQQASSRNQSSISPSQPPIQGTFSAQLALRMASAPEPLQGIRRSHRPTPLALTLEQQEEFDKVPSPFLAKVSPQVSPRHQPTPQETGQSLDLVAANLPSQDGNLSVSRIGYGKPDLANEPGGSEPGRPLVLTGSLLQGYEHVSTVDVILSLFDNICQRHLAPDPLRSLNSSTYGNE